MLQSKLMVIAVKKLKHHAHVINVKDIEGDKNTM